MIPQEKKAAVEKALQASFGVSDIEDIRELTAGLSTAKVYRIVVLGRAYLLRIIMREDVLGNLANQYANMKAAAEAGIAPNVWYTGMDDKISISDFIEAKPFPIDIARVKLPELLKRLHSLPHFPAQVNYLDAMDRLVKKFQAANILPGYMTDEVFDKYEAIRSVYPRYPEDLVSSHNDAKADNILFDGERTWLVDWEASFLNDRYLDLAIVANFVVWSNDDEKEYLSYYFGWSASEYQQARFFLMCQMLHIFYISFLLAGPNSPIVQDEDMSRPGFRDFHNLLWDVKVNIGEPGDRLQYALVHMDQLLDNLKLKRFEESLKIVSMA